MILYNPEISQLKKNSPSILNMEQLQLIIEEGKQINEKTITPTIEERFQNKIEILRLLKDKDTFVMNKKFFIWKQKIENKEISSSEENTEWILDPLLIFCTNPEETSKMICDGLFQKDKKYIRYRNDVYLSRVIIDVDFEVMAYVSPVNKPLLKHTENFTFYNANINTNGALILPILLYEYITPKFSYEEWKNNLEMEPFLWNQLKQKWVKNGVNPPNFNKLEISQKILNVIKAEDESAYLFTGYFTYFMMINQKGDYQGDYHIYHRDPLDFLQKIHESIPDLKIKEEQPVYFFQTKQYTLVHNNDVVLTVYNLEFPLNFVRLGYFNHTNYHGLLMFLLIEAFKGKMREYDEKIGNIGYLIKYRNGYSGGHNFNILQNNIIGPRTSPTLELRKKAWNKELKIFYRPDKVEIEEEKEST